MSSLRQGMQQKLLQKLSPQQIQLMKLLQIPVASIEQRIKEEIQENPALEEGHEPESEEEEKPEIKAEESSEEPEEPQQEDEEITEREEDISIEEYIDEGEIPDYRTASSNSSPDDERKEVPLTAYKSFQDQLLSQLYQLNINERQHRVAEQLVGSFDDDGYLRRDLNAVVDDLA